MLFNCLFRLHTANCCKGRLSQIRKLHCIITVSYNIMCKNSSSTIIQQVLNLSHLNHLPLSLSLCLPVTVTLVVTHTRTFLLIHVSLQLLFTSDNTNKSIWHPHGLSDTFTPPQYCSHSSPPLLKSLPFFFIWSQALYTHVSTNLMANVSSCK